MTALDRIREICHSYPATEERLSHGTPTFFAGGKKVFVMYAEDFGVPMPAIWIPTDEGVQEALVGSEPERYFRPPYVGVKGWLGIRLNSETDWDETESLVDRAWRKVAPKRLVNSLT